MLDMLRDDIFLFRRLLRHACHATLLPSLFIATLIKRFADAAATYAAMIFADAAKMLLIFHFMIVY